MIFIIMFIFIVHTLIANFHNAPFCVFFYQLQKISLKIYIVVSGIKLI